MGRFHLLAVSTAMAILPIFPVAKADAQQRSVSGPRIALPSHANHFSWERGHGFRGLHGGVFIVERVLRQAQGERVVVVEREASPPPSAIPLPEQAQGGAKARKSFVVGGTYASLPPQGCMKLIEDGASYYFCSGEEWYRQLGDGRGERYRAVARP